MYPSLFISMKIIQSYWACGQKDLITNQHAWLSPEYGLMAWALSCLQLRQFYSDVVFYGDDASCEMLIDTLKLPYTTVISELNLLDNYHPELWALPKIHVYAQQKKPFLHVDGDVFIWKAFDRQLMKSGLIAQNLESATRYYESIMTELETNLSYFPPEITEERTGKVPILAYNAGIFGGNDLLFFKQYAEKAFEFVNRNLSDLHKIRVTNFNIFFEQYLFYCMAKQQQKSVGVLFEQVIGDNEYKGFGDFIEVPYNKTYLHTLGTYKKSPMVCKQLASRLRQDYPEYYYRIVELYKRSGINLKYDHYYFMPSIDAESLKARSEELKNWFETGIASSKSDQKLVFAELHPTLEQHVDREDAKQDLQRLIAKIKETRNVRFAKISKDYLYARDLHATGYTERLFSNEESIFGQKLVSDSDVTFVRSKFDWAPINEPNFLKGLLNAKPGNVFIGIIPECTIEGFSLAYADALDLEIFEYLKKPRSVAALLNECKKLFSKKDYEDSKEAFQKLIFGRIKRGFYAKTLRFIKNADRPWQG